MSQCELDNLVRIGRLKTEQSAKSELDGLLRLGQSRLADAEHSDLSIESRFDLGCNAAHVLALAAFADKMVTHRERTVR